MSNRERLLRTTPNAQNEERDRKLKTYVWFFAAALWISMSAQGLQAQQTACTGPSDVGATLKALGISLPVPSAPVANYVPAVRTGNLIFLAGTAPQYPDGTRITGKVGTDLTVDQGYQAARLVGINLLSSLQAAIGDLNKVKRIVKVFGMVNADPAFTQHPTVINGISDLMVAVFGDCGKHARTAVGMGSLPFGIAVEIDMVVEVADSASSTTSAVANPKGLTTTNFQEQLDGTASTSTDGKALSYSWTQPASSPVATIIGATTAKPLVQFTGGSGNYTFILTVTDGTNKTATDTAAVTYLFSPH